jgi:hypothetical protein
MPHIDPVCLIHGKPWSENPPHWAGRCMYCCLCFKEFKSLEEMYLRPDGFREDIDECVSYSIIVASRMLSVTIPSGSRHLGHPVSELTSLPVLRMPPMTMGVSME